MQKRAIIHIANTNRWSKHIGYRLAKRALEDPEKAVTIYTIEHRWMTRQSVNRVDGSSCILE